MKISSVKFEHRSVRFNANIKFVQNGAKKLLSQQSMEVLTKKAQGIGRKSDIITIYLSQKKADDFASFQEDLFKDYTKITGEFGNESSMCLPYLTEIGDVYGDINSRQNKAFVLAEHFIERIASALK